MQRKCSGEGYRCGLEECSSGHWDRRIGHRPIMRSAVHLDEAAICDQRVPECGTHSKIWPSS